MKKFLFSLLLLTTTAFGALTEVDKSIYSERNLLPNPGFESGKSGWVTSDTTFSATTTTANVLHGKASGSILITSNGGYIRSRTIAVPVGMYGQACEVNVLYKGGDALATLEVYNRDNELLGSQVLRANTDPGLVSAYFTCPSAAQVAADADDGFIYTQIKQTTAGTHAVLYADDWYVGRLKGLGEATLPDVFSAKVSSAGVVSAESSDWINGNCAVGGDIVCSFNSGIFSVAPNCFITTNAQPGTDQTPEIDGTLTSSSSVSYIFHQAGVGDVAQAGTLMCMKQGVDAKQSVQVYKNIPKIAENINEFTASVSSAGVVTGENADWINGSCSVASPFLTCSFNSSVFSNTPNCTLTNNYPGTPAGTDVPLIDATGTSSTAIKYTFHRSGTGNITGAAILSCQKSGTDYELPVVQPIYSPESLVGSVVQTANYQTGALQTGTTVLLADDTIPQNTEGNEFMTLAFTPRSATNKLKITVNAFTAMSTGIGTVTTMALFQDSTADAIAATVTSAPQAHAPISSTLVHYMTAGTTSATTFKVRMGLNGAGTITFNGANSGRLYGGVAASSITIEEIQQ